MNRFIISLTSLAAVSFVLASPMSAQAHPIHPAHPAHPVVHPHPVHPVHGGYHYGNYHFTRYQYRDYRGWSRWNWNSRYGCYFYLCPTDNAWYYWYQPSNCYLPVDGIGSYAPTPYPMTPPAALPPTPPYPPGV